MNDDVHERCRPPNGPPSIRIIEALADALDVDPLTLDPVSHYVDLEAVDELFAPGTANPDYVCFDYDGHTVYVYENGSIEVTRA